MNSMNNPIFAQLFQSGKNPLAMLELLAQSDPQARQVQQMLRGKSPAQLEQMARNMARERGTTIEEIARSIGVQLP